MLRQSRASKQRLDMNTASNLSGFASFFIYLEAEGQGIAYLE